MADSTPQRRVLPARERRGSAAKRRASSPITPQKSAGSFARKPNTAKSTSSSYVRKKNVVGPAPPERYSTPFVDESLPTRITEARPLPVVRQAQPEQLSLQDYRSLAESAVLAASLHRSRAKWLCDGIFQRYWTKPSKRKCAPEVAANNPDQKSMQKLGTCTITIEPHSFDAVIYTVPDVARPMPVYYRHPNQYPQKLPPQTYPNPYTSVPSPVTNSSACPPIPVIPRTAKPENVPLNLIKQEGGFHEAPQFVAEPNRSYETSEANMSRGSDTPRSAPPTRSADTMTPAPTSTKPNTDPVIQMLATRAAADPELKALMKIVASSKASPDQLKRFQNHIDELNGIIRRQDAERIQWDQDYERRNSQPQSSQKLTKQKYPQGGQFSTPSDSTHNPVLYDIPGPYQTTSYQDNLPPQLVAPKKDTSKTGAVSSVPKTPYGPYPPPLARPPIPIKHIVMEFHSPASSTQTASQDRWLFPEYAVLETPPSGQGLEMVCSFFVIRQSSHIIAAQSNGNPEVEANIGSKWTSKKEYYQAITMVLKTPVHKTLETIARNAKSLPEVQQYMLDVMAQKTRAPTEFLATRLPKEKGIGVDTDVTITNLTSLAQGDEDAKFMDSGIELDTGDEGDQLKDYYGI